MAWPNIVAATTHVVNDGISIDANTFRSASLNQITKLFSCSMTTRQLVADGLIVEPPRVQLSILRPLIREDTFLRWENFDSHPTHLSKRSALFLDVSIWPSKHFKNSSLLALLILVADRNMCSLPNKIERLKVDFPCLTIVVGSANSHWKGTRERGINGEGHRILETFTSEVIFNFGDACVLTASDLDGG